MNTMTLIGQNSSLGEEVMTITMPSGDGVMAHNLPLLYVSFILGGIKIAIYHHHHCNKHCLMLYV